MKKSVLRPQDNIYIVCPNCGLPFIKKYSELSNAERHNCPHCKLFIEPEAIAKAFDSSSKMTEKTLESLSRQGKRKKG